VLSSIVLFDLGDVVADFDPAPRIAEFARHARLTGAEVTARLSAGDFWRNTDRGACSSDEMHEQICTRLDYRFSRAELLRLQAAAFTLRPEVVRLAIEVSARARVGVLTNNAPLLQDALPTHFPELTRVFAPILYSFEFGCAKPERALFERVAARMALEPKQIVFVDDQVSHVEAARSVGWDALRFESVAGLRCALADRGLLSAQARE